MPNRGDHRRRVLGALGWSEMISGQAAGKSSGGGEEIAGARPVHVADSATAYGESGHDSGPRIMPAGSVTPSLRRRGAPPRRAAGDQAGGNLSASWLASSSACSRLIDPAELRRRARFLGRSIGKPVIRRVPIAGNSA